MDNELQDIIKRVEKWVLSTTEEELSVLWDALQAIHVRSLIRGLNKMDSELQDILNRIEKWIPDRTEEEKDVFWDALHGIHLMTLVAKEMA